MATACAQGHLHVAHWLFDHGAAGDVRQASHDGKTPLLRACAMGHLDVAKWLFADAVGAAGDVQVACAAARTPAFMAAMNGRLPVLQWLFAAGAADAHPPPLWGLTAAAAWAPLQAGCLRGDVIIVLWLLLHAASSCAQGRLPPGLLAEVRLSLASRQQMRALVTQTLSAQATFVGLVLTATAHHQDPEVAQSLGLGATPPVAACALPLLCGHERTLLGLVADFAGVARGRQLRTLREINDYLAAGA
jgi:hypothetical protein